MVDGDLLRLHVTEACCAGGDARGAMPGERASLRFRIDDAPVRPPAGSPAPTRPADRRERSKASSSTPSAAAQAPAAAQRPSGRRAAAADDEPSTSPAQRPRAGSSDAARGATGSSAPPRAATGDRPKAAIEGKRRPAVPTPVQPKERPRAAGERDAARLDSIPRAEKERLLAEQQEFFGAGLPKGPPVGGRVGPVSGTGATVEPVRGTGDPHVTSGAAEDPKGSDAVPRPGAVGEAGHRHGIDGTSPEHEPVIVGTAGPGGPDGPKRPTHAERVKFFSEREQWIAPDGDVWHVEVTDDDLVVLSRTGDPDGLVTPGVPTAVKLDPPKPPPPPKEEAPGWLGRLVDKVVDVVTLDGAGSDPVSDGHDHGGAAAAAADDPRAQLARGRSRALAGVAGEVPATGTAAGAVEPPATQSADGRLVLYPDGRSVQSTEQGSTWADGTSVRLSHRTSDGPRIEHLGFEASLTTRATRPDGAQAIVRERTALGIYASPAKEQPAPGGMAEEMSQRVSIRGADGSWRHTDSARPSPRKTPATLEELRAAQDELGRAHAAVPGDLPVIQPTTAADVFAMAEHTAMQIDVEEIGRSVQAGARHIAGRPELVDQYAERQFATVQERFREWGLDAAEGNEAITRRWHEPRLVDNAYYDGEKDEMVFGVSQQGTPIGMSDDAIAHEFAHRVIKANGDIRYEGQPGAINESIADVMAAAVDSEDWLIVEDAIPGGLRDMSRPATMDDYLDTTEDHGGIHVNSAIPNHAAYLIGEQVGRDRMGAIYARTIREHLKHDMEFTDLATSTHRAAVELYGRDSSEARAVVQAWDGVLHLDGDRSLFE